MESRASRALAAVSRGLLRIDTPRARAAYGVSLGASLIAATASSLLGLVVAWVLARIEFPGRRILDALVDDMMAHI